MTEADRLQLGAEQAGLNLELDKLKEEKKDVNAVYRVKIRETEEKIHTLAAQLDEGAFEVKFEVVEVPDDARQMISIRRRDNDAQINVRPMTEAEKDASRKRRQGDLFEGEGEKGDGAERAPVRGIFGSKGKSKKKNGKR
jgi:hypothetical protein